MTRKPSSARPDARRSLALCWLSPSARNVVQERAGRGLPSDTHGQTGVCSISTSISLDSVYRHHLALAFLASSACRERIKSQNQAAVFQLTRPIDTCSISVAEEAAVSHPCHHLSVSHVRAHRHPKAVTMHLHTRAVGSPYRTTAEHRGVAHYFSAIESARQSPLGVQARAPKGRPQALERPLAGSLGVGWPFRDRPIAGCRMNRFDRCANARSSTALTVCGPESACDDGNDLRN